MTNQEDQEFFGDFENAEPDPNERALRSDPRGGSSDGINRLHDTARSLRDNAERARKVGSSAAKSAGVAAKVAVNPATWITLLVVVALIFGYSTTFVVGKNENVCVGTAESTAVADVGPIKLDPSGVANKESAWATIGGWLMSYNFKFLGNKPMSKEQAAGVIGNMMRESGLTPNMPQGGFDCPTCGWISRTAPNEQALSAGSGGGKALGLIQWDGVRRKALVEFAMSKNKPWYDAVTQLEFMVKELDGSEGSALKRSNFAKPGLTVEEYTTIWEDTYERAGVPALPERIKNAQDFYTNYKGGGGGVLPANGSGSQGCGGAAGSGSFDASGVVQLAISIAWPSKAQSLNKPGDPNGCLSAKPEYIAAKAAAEQKTNNDTHSEGGPCAELYASCDRFVATVMRNTVDPQIPWGATDTVQKYLSTSPKWQRYTNRAEAKPGDIWVTQTRGHIIVYVGQVNGVDSIAHASYRDRTGAITPASYVKSNFVDTNGRAYYGYHFVGG